MISIVIPLYNKEKQILNTLKSVFNQTFQDFEIIVVNDGSTDDSLAELKKMSDSRIRIVNQNNGGVSAARNRGIDEARWNLIAFLDADDEWKPEYLQTQYELFHKYPECSVFACNYEFRNSCGKITPTTIRRLTFNKQDGILTNYFKVASYSHPPICSISIMVKKEAIQRIGGFPVGTELGEDLLTWTLLALKYSIAYSQKAEAIYCLVPNNSRRNLPADLTLIPDHVGEKLELLLKENQHNSAKGELAQYISFWYKMRSSINLEWGNHKAAFMCAARSLKFNWKNGKAFILLFASLIPGNAYNKFKKQKK